MRLRTDTVLRRGARLVLAFWLVIGPFVLGYGDTPAQRFESTLGLLTFPLMVLGIVIPGVRVVLILVGAVLIGAPFWSGLYFQVEAGQFNAVIVGVLAVVLGIVPLRRTSLFRPEEPQVEAHAPPPRVRRVSWRRRRTGSLTRS